MSLFILQSSGGGILGFMPLILMAVVIYFFFIRPQTKRQKEQNSFMDDLQKGDEVVTGSGIIGRIKSIEGNVVQLQVDSKTFLRITKNSISKEMTDGVTAASEAKDSEK